MDNMTNLVSWILIIVGAIVTFLVKPLLSRKVSEADEAAKQALDKKIYISKTIGMWLVIIGAAVIFISGGLYGRQ